MVEPDSTHLSEPPAGPGAPGSADRGRVSPPPPSAPSPVHGVDRARAAFADPAAPAANPTPPASAPGRGTDAEPGRGRREFGWREGLLLGAIVLVVVYAIAELTAWLPALRDGLEHLPVTIALLVVGTLAVLVAVGRSARRR